MPDENLQSDDSQKQALGVHTAVADKDTAEVRQLTGEAVANNGFAAHVTLAGGNLVPEAYDYVDLNYTDGDLTEVIFKTGGAAGTTVATLDLTYSSGLLDTVTKT